MCIYPNSNNSFETRKCCNELKWKGLNDETVKTREYLAISMYDDVVVKMRVSHYAVK